MFRRCSSGWDNRGRGLGYGIAFAPLVAMEVLWAALLAGALVAVLLILARSRGAALRIVALALLVLALATPSFPREDRELLPSGPVVVLDKSPSQGFGDRTAQTASAPQALGRPP